MEISNSIVLYGYRIGVPLIAGGAGALAIGFVGTDLVIGTLENLTSTLQKNKVLESIFGGLAIGVAVGVAINFGAAKDLLGISAA